jgi:hypothetical protein
LNPAYIDVAIEQWQTFTGEDAVLGETSETFSDLKTRSQNLSDSNKL